MNKLGKRFLFCLLPLLLIQGVLFFNCKKQEKIDSRVPEAGSENKTEAPAAAPHAIRRIPILDTITPMANELSRLPFSTGAHSEHLNDPLKFYDVPDGGIPKGPTAVVGSDECLFYPEESISRSDELDKLPQGELIPFATIIPIGEKLQCSDANWEGLFTFQGHYNYFYKTNWKGKAGIVFGADLYGINASNEENRINALLYKEKGWFKNFYPVAGYDRINTWIHGELETGGLAFQEVRPKEYRLHLGQPDDMISLYIELLYKPMLPIFVTTDLAAHANHLVFDRLLQYLEEREFFPRLLALTDEYIEAIENTKGQVPRAVHNTSLLYFRTAQALLALADTKVENDDYYKTIEYQEADASKVLMNYPKEVVSEVEKIYAAGGINESSVFNFMTAPEAAMKEDYSQYKVRGHYTKNEILGAYFRALMWYGRINFNLGGDNAEIKNLAAHLAPVALFITDLTENTPALKKLWRSLFDPMTELIGASDDISINDILPLWNKIKGAGFAQWYNDPARREAFISKEYGELKRPAISGFSLDKGPHSGGEAMEDRLPPVGWRLFGQRYTLDSEIHHHVSPPRFIARGVSLAKSRNMVQGLDILKVFGSKTADHLLKKKEFPGNPGLEERMNLLQQDLLNVKEEYWLSTYYTNTLYQIKTLALFENGAGFYFTEKPGWNLKAMNSAHGTWAELRHDTILYVKQSSAEKGGDGPGTTFRTKPLPRPVHYIEPNIPFWITSAMGIQKIYDVLEKYDLLDGMTAQALSRLHDIFSKAAEISALEADNQEVSRNDLTWISHASRQLAIIVLTHAGGSDGWAENNDNLRMALVADVYTNAEIGMVLETAVGIPYRLYIPLNDKQGGKRIAVGYGFSYYEFAQPVSNRLNNDEWKAIVYGDNPNMGKYLPFWMQGRVLPPK